MKKHLLFLFATLLPLLASAQTKVEIDGIWYNLTAETSEAEVTSSPAKYRGDLIIPAIVVFQEKSYEVTTIGDNAFASCGLLSSIVIPQGVVRIGDNAFSSCHSLSSIIIPQGVESIGNYALYNCSSLTAIVLPEGLKKIGFSAFAFCTMLEEVYCYEKNAPLAEPNAFDGSNLKRAILHLLPNTIDNYKSTSPWNKFGNIADEGNTKNIPTDIGVRGTYDLAGRNLTGSGLPSPVNTIKDEGRVVVNITVNPSGEVIATSINRRTNTVNPDLRQAAINAAAQAMFNKINSKDIQTGTITYYFK